MTLSQCPRCGSPRQGTTRFCSTCAFDFWKAAQGAEQPTDPRQVAPSAAEPSTRPNILLVAGVVLLFALLAGGAYSILNQPDDGGAIGANPTAEETADPTPLPTPDQRATDCVAAGGSWSAAQEECSYRTPEPTFSPPDTSATASLGVPVAIECGGVPCLNITVSDPSFHEVYVDPDGYYNDQPQIPGNVFMQVFVEYEALSNAADFNPFDWQVFVDDALVDTYAYTAHGPKPELGSGQLPEGRTASGWLVYEVAPTGEIVLAYAPNFEGAPVFEITIRE